MIVLGIETSCDETAAAVVDGGRKVLSSVVASQDAIHGPYGGVVPELASRQHLAVDPAGDPRGALARRRRARRSRRDRRHPRARARRLAPRRVLRRQVDRLRAPHAAGRREPPRGPHLRRVSRAPRADRSRSSPSSSPAATPRSTWRGPPAQYERIGQTRDDAAGEAFDKVAKLLGPGLPGRADDRARRPAAATRARSCSRPRR